MAQVYDPETNDSTSRWAPGEGHNAPAGKSSDPRGDLQQAESGGNNFYNPDGEKSLDADSLNSAENFAGNDTLGRGFNAGDTGGSDRLKSFLQNKRRLRNAVGVSAVCATITGLLIAGFLALLPLRIESLIQNVKQAFGATSEKAIGDTGERLFDRYMINKVLPNIGGACHSTISAKCSAAKSSGNGPVPRLYNAWRETKLENKLAKKYGIVLGKQNGKYYINTNGKKFDLGKNPSSIFDMPGTTSTRSRAEVRAAISKALEGETLWKRVFFRFRYGKFIAKKYGIVRCVITCKVGDKFADKVAVKKLAAKAYIAQRVIAPVSENYAIIMLCVASGECDNTSLERATPDQDTRRSKGEAKILENLHAYMELHKGDRKLAELIGKADEIGKDGFSKFLAKKIGEKIGGEAGSKVVGHSVPFIGWIVTIVRITNAMSTIGPMLKYMSYATNAAAAVQLYQAYATVSSEMKSGNVDATELGSFTDALSTNLDGSDGNQSDGTQTPLYQHLYGSNSPDVASVIGGIFTGNIAYADSTQPEKKYTCDNGQPVPAGELVCSEEKLANGNKTIDKISGSVRSVTSKIPGYGALAGVANAYDRFVGDAFGAVFGPACNLIWGCKDATTKIGDWTKDLAKSMVVSPFSPNQSGGRTSDMIIAGGDVAYNSACQEELGCAKMSDVAVNNIRNEMLAKQQAEFNSQSVFARMFSTDSPYSMVSRLAMVMPTNLQSASSSFAGLLTNSFSTFGNAIFSIFSPAKAFAGTPPAKDPFGVIQNGVGEVPDNPGKYWDDNCVNGPMGKYDEATGKLDISDWLNNSDNVTQDKNTGEAVYLKPNYCKLIQSSVEALGGMSDSSLLPQDTMNGGTGSSGDTSEPAASGDVQDLAQQLLDSPNVSFPYHDAVSGLTVGDVLKQVAKTGKGQVNSPDVSFREVAVSPKLLQALIEYAKDHKIGLNALTNGDHSSTSNHYKGIAVDIACSPALDRAAFEKIATKYGGKNNGEVCPGNSHWHYDFPKQ